MRHEARPRFRALGDVLKGQAGVGAQRKCLTCKGQFTATRPFSFTCDDCYAAGKWPPSSQTRPALGQNIETRLDDIDKELGRYGGRLDRTIRIPIIAATWDYYESRPWGTPEDPDDTYYTADGYLKGWPNRHLLVLLGGVGRGKTYLAALIAKEVALKGALIQFLRWQRFIERWKASPDWGEFARREIDPIMNIDLLVIDEIGRESMTSNERIRLETILDHRYETRQPTILASNLSLDGFRTYVQPAAWSRIEDWSDGGREIYILPGPDRRKRIEAVQYPLLATADTNERPDVDA